MSMFNAVAQQHFSRFSRGYTGLLIFLPILCYFSLIKIYGVNAPWFDDLRDILEFMVAYHDADNSWDKFVLLFKQHNQHRTAVSHVIYLLQYRAFGSLHFTYLMIIGNLAAVGILLCYLYLFKGVSSRVFIMMGVSLLTFQPHAFLAMFWAMAALSSYLVLVFALLSFMFLQHGSYKAVICAGAFATLAIFTNANGIFVPLAMVLLLLLKLFSRDGAWSCMRAKIPALFLFLAFCAVSLSWFFSGYDSGHETVSPLVRLKFQFSNLEWLAKNALFLIGSGYSFKSYFAGIVLGAIAAVLIAGLVYKRYYDRQPALFAFLIFLLLSLGAVAVMRGEIDKPVVLMSTHYFHLSMHIWVILFAAYADLYLPRLRRSSPRAPAFLLVLLGVFFIGSYVYHTPRVVDACIEKKSWIYKLNQDLLVGTVNRDKWDRLVLKALHRGYFDGNPGAKERALPFLSDAQSCYIGGWNSLRQ